MAGLRFYFHLWNLPVIMNSNQKDKKFGFFRRVQKKEKKEDIRFFV